MNLLLVIALQAAERWAVAGSGLEHWPPLLCSQLQLRETAASNHEDFPHCGNI